MKLRVLIPFSAILILSCKTNLKKNEHLVLPGHGFDKLILGETTKDDLINIYGENYSIDTFYFQRPFKKEIFSIGVNYKERGIMVAFNQNHKHINGILIKSPFNAVTKEGIKLNVSTFNDVERKYGKTKWILIGHDLCLILK